MITIQKNKSIKCGCEDSIFVSFPYDVKVIDIIRTFPVRYWHPDIKKWELPYSSLNKLECLLNAENYVLTKDFENSNFILPSGFSFKTTPFKHQIEGIQYGMQMNTWLLGDEQGCVSSKSKVRIKEKNKPATRLVSINNLNKLFEKDNTIKIKCLVNGRFVYMPIKKVIDKGNKKTIRITLSNTYLDCTPDHLIYTQRGWVEAGKLVENDLVYTNGKQVCPICGTSENLITYKNSKFLGYCKECMYKSRNGKHYKGDSVYKEIDKGGYIRLFGKPTRNMPNYNKMRGMGIYEHHQVWYENTGHIVDTSKEVIHHKNGIKTDNRFENLQLFTTHEHALLHSDTLKNNLYQFNENLDYVYRNGTKILLVPELTRVVKIEKSKIQRVWDIAIDDNEIHNFICNNIVVHNCGKSKIIIDLAVIKKKMYEFYHCLIICGVNSLKWNWVKEINTHSDEKAWVLGQRFKAGKLDVDSNQAKLEDVQNLIDNDSYFIITNIETLRNGAIVDELVKLCKKGIINMIALDEAHAVRNPSSQQAKGLLKLQPKCRIAMTGTPLMNSPLDLYPILKWIGYESHNFYSFKNHHCIMGGYGNYQIVGYKNLDELQSTLNSVMLRRLKSDVLDLPEKLYVDEIIEMTPKQSIVYKEVLSDTKNNIDKIISSSVNPLSALIRLRQATGNTEILSTRIKESAKYDRMMEIVDEAVKNDKKIIIFSNWVKVIQPAYEMLNKSYKGLIITGETKDTDRQKYIDLFQSDNDYKFICGTIGAIGTGVTLTAASVEVFLDEPWTKASKEQAVDRAYRIGTNESITVYTLLCKDTIDCRVNEIVNRKGYMSDAIVDGTVTGNKLETLNYLLN